MKPENHKRKAFLNSVSSLIDIVTKAIVSIFINKFLILYLGTEKFGIWNVLKQFNGYLNVLDTRSSEPLKWKIAKDRETKSESHLIESISSAFYLSFFSLPIILFGGWALANFAPHLFNVGEKNIDIVKSASYFLVFSFVINKVFSIFDSLLRGMNIGYKRIGLKSFIFIFDGFLTYIVLRLGYGLVGVASIQVLTSIFYNLLLYTIIKREIGWFKLVLPKIDSLKAFFGLSTSFFSWSLVYIGLNSSDLVFLGYLSDTQFVSKYVITKYLISTISLILVSIFSGVIPGLGVFFGRRDLERILYARSLIQETITFVLLNSAMFILLFNKNIVFLWINSSIFTTDAENFLIFLSVSLWNYIIIDNAFINITLKVGKKIYWGLFSLVFTLFGYYYLIPTNGVLGLCVALIIGRVVFIFLLNTIVNEEYGIVPNKKFYSLIHPISFVFFSTFLYLNVEFFDVNSFKLNVKIILFIFFFALTLFTYLFLLKTKAQRSQIVVYLKKSLNKTNQDK